MEGEIDTVSIWHYGNGQHLFHIPPLGLPSYSIIMLSTSISLIMFRFDFFFPSIFNNFIIAPYRYANWWYAYNTYHISPSKKVTHERRRRRKKTTTTTLDNNACTRTITTWRVNRREFVGVKHSQLSKQPKYSHTQFGYMGTNWALFFTLTSVALCSCVANVSQRKFFIFNLNK